MRKPTIDSVVQIVIDDEHLLHLAPIDIRLPYFADAVGNVFIRDGGKTVTPIGKSGMAAVYDEFADQYAVCSMDSYAERAQQFNKCNVPKESMVFVPTDERGFKYFLIQEVPEDLTMLDPLVERARARAEHVRSQRSGTYDEEACDNLRLRHSVQVLTSQSHTNGIFDSHFINGYTPIKALPRKNK